VEFWGLLPLVNLISVNCATAFFPGMFLYYPKAYFFGAVERVPLSVPERLEAGSKYPQTFNFFSRMAGLILRRHFVPWFLCKR
jgi:hypothetical protein